MKIDEKEKIEVGNLLKIIRRASFEKIQGVEALALTRAYHWLESLLKEEPMPVAPAMAVEEKKHIEIMPAPAKEKGRKK